MTFEKFKEDLKWFMERIGFIVTYVGFWIINKLIDIYKIVRRFYLKKSRGYTVDWIEVDD